MRFGAWGTGADESSAANPPSDHYPPAMPILAFCLFLLTAFLYSAVGHGGASGYLAAMALMGVEPALMKPVSLSLNVLVSLIATVQFGRAGHFRWRLFWPFAVMSVPAAMVGGAIDLPGWAYRPLIGAVLLFSAWRLLVTASGPTIREPKLGDADQGVDPTPSPTGLTGTDLLPTPPPLPIALAVGLGLGFLAGLSGTGGGIFLSPILLLLGWATPRQTAAVSALFILMNSLAGLGGLLLSGRPIPEEFALWIAPWAGAAVIGGFLGSWLGARRLSVSVLRRVLAAVLIIAGAKLIVS